MKLRNVLIINLAAYFCASSAFAAVPPAEAAKLGGELTEFGAIKAGNQAGTIPAYTGGITTIPAQFDPKAGFWADPYKDDKPRLRITADNMSQYADQLSEGVKHLLKTNKDYYLDIYPSHRSIAYPASVLQASKRNALTCKTTNDALAVSPDCRGGVPFPIPTNGNEMMWNKILSYNGQGALFGYGSRNYIVPANGSFVMTSQIRTYTEKPYYQTDRTDRQGNMTLRLYSQTDAPSRKAGEATGYSDFLDPLGNPRKAWSYTPGQRRIKMAPEFSYDTPVSTTGGVMLYDELYLFNGAMDRFDFKLVGKKEMFIPYNNYKMLSPECTPEKKLKPGFVSPECERWELHRVWEVEATLKPGMRHVYKKRTYYFDEDDLTSGMFDGWDQNGTLYRTGYLYSAALYDSKAMFDGAWVIFDFNKGMYSFQSDVSGGKDFYRNDVKSERELSPESIAGSGIR
ncbi:DUF1329 domain-containing protein [Pseudomonas silvicola]|nr:DUF1329 domain-containing protein [Pseudomonas silvicola]